METLLFVMNPYSGTRKAAKVLPDILSVFNRAGYKVIAHMTDGVGDAESFVRSNARDADLVVCCGGDGTFNETVSGLLRSCVDIPMGYIPAGSTNDFATSLKLSTDPVQAALDIVTGHEEAFDIGMFGDRYFSYVASFGAFTRVSYATPQSVKNTLGHTAYLLSGIQELSQIKAVPVRLELADRVIEDTFVFGAICNSTSVGGVLTLDANQVNLQDGKFELLLVRAPKDVTELGECILALQQKQYNCKMITFLSTDKVTVTTGWELDWALDGEWAPGQGEIRAENLHNAYRLILPGEGV